MNCRRETDLLVVIRDTALITLRTLHALAR